MCTKLLFLIVASPEEEADEEATDEEADDEAAAAVDTAVNW